MRKYLDIVILVFTIVLTMYIFGIDMKSAWFFYSFLTLILMIVYLFRVKDEECKESEINRGKNFFSIITDCVFSIALAFLGAIVISIGLDCGYILFLISVSYFLLKNIYFISLGNKIFHINIIRNNKKMNIYIVNLLYLSPTLLILLSSNDRYERTYYFDLVIDVLFFVVTLDLISCFIKKDGRKISDMLMGIKYQET